MPVSTQGSPWFYPDRVSVSVGDRVAIHASAEHGPCRLIVRRVGASEHVCAEFEGIEVDSHPVPDDADQKGCDWPVAHSFEVGSDWPAGYIDLELVDAAGSSTRHFVCLRSEPTGSNRALVVLATNTYQAYNYWGGANSYADVDALMRGEVDASGSLEGAIGRSSSLRPYPPLLLAPPADAPRLVNRVHRKLGEAAFPIDLEWARTYQPSPYDGSAGFLNKWEHAFVEWAETNGYPIDFACDHDFELDGHLLDRYAAVLIVGHSEYWSEPQRDQLERFVDCGGRLAIFSGNTGYWKVRWEDEHQTLVAHKWRGETDDPLWASSETRPRATHLWSHPAFDRPEAALTGLSFLYGGYHRIAMCAARGAGGYTVYRDDHWALADTDLYYGDTFGSELPLLGYENDGCPLRIGEDGLPAPDTGVGIPGNLEIIAIAPATLFEPPESPYPPIIPPEEPVVLARIAHGRSDEEGIRRLRRGHAVMASFARGQGEVFNAGTTEWAHGLAASNPFVERITRNVLERFLRA